MAQLTELAGSNPPNQPSDLIDEIMNQIRGEIEENELEFTPSSILFEYVDIYSAYANVSQLNDGRKNAAELCPGCGD